MLRAGIMVVTVSRVRDMQAVTRRCIAAVVGTDILVVTLGVVRCRDARAAHAGIVRAVDTVRASVAVIRCVNTTPRRTAGVIGTFVMVVTPGVFRSPDADMLVVALVLRRAVDTVVAVGPGILVAFIVTLAAVAHVLFLARARCRPAGHAIVDLRVDTLAI
jgi:hypothetical protein